ncbi:MAG TPA: ATP-binding protein, partial [Negativicutes bacterium]
MTKLRPMKLRFFINFTVTSLIPLFLAISIMYYTFFKSVEDQLAIHALDVAQLTANIPTVQLGYASSNPADILQPLAEDIRHKTKVDFVVFMNRDKIRYSQPNPFYIGKVNIATDLEPALTGQSYTSLSHSVAAPGYAIRAFTPIYNDQKEMLGIVMVGFNLPQITYFFSNIYKTLYVVIPLSLFLVVIFSLILANNIKKTMLGLEPLEIATLLKERDCMLHSVKEGIIAIDQHSKITVVSQATKSLFPPGTEFIGCPIEKLISNSHLPMVMETKQPLEDEQLTINGHIVLINRFPLIIDDVVMGAIATFRPLTEVNRIAEELTGVKKIVNALRAHTHEFQNKLHVISGLIQLGAFDQVQSYISNLTSREQLLVSFLIDRIKISTIIGLLLGKVSEAHEKHIQLEIDKDCHLLGLPDYFNEHAMIVVLGNLIDNAFSAAQKNKNKSSVRLLIKQDRDAISIEVADTGRGIPPENLERIFDPGFTTKET